MWCKTKTVLILIHPFNWWKKEIRMGGRSRAGASAGLLVLLVLRGPSVAGAGCPMGCNSRGNCNSAGQCECWAGFQGAACGEFTCPLGVPWFEAAPATDTAHRPLTATECSSMGDCSRIKGTCKCYDGFEGVACEIMSCPANCNGHGRCFSLREAAEEVGADEKRHGARVQPEALATVCVPLVPLLGRQVAHGRRCRRCGTERAA